MQQHGTTMKQHAARYNNEEHPVLFYQDGTDPLE